MSLGDLISGVNNFAQSVGNSISGAFDNVSTWCSGLLAQVGAGISSQFDGDVVGLNVNGVDSMVEAIESYIAEIKSHLDQVAKDAETNKAMKGEYAAAVKTYVETAAQVCYNIVTQLRFFEDKIIGVKEAYAQKDEHITSEVSQTTGDLASQYQEYQRQS